ncbi:energy-coupling factor transporter transmembrane component T family protein [Weissella halotolerans]|uniref:ABC superfamily ATP binding cassette transporter, permease protein n=1 Tax=Weissella halotolerans DSM 20190 TaxID=1123500 RepID=A0A0R2G9F9_9LACO|nr:energy-coupling factor transporter transmembrane component T [Weissella halotolerans]KRN33293.1 ABC superfamily ATP binding cassette transporter, permease protein [Weissella halotolerans DSM 20190]
MKLNPTVILVIMLGIGVPMSFAQSIWLNLGVIVLATAYLISQPIRWRTVFWVLLLALPMAIGTAWSFLAFGRGDTWHSAALYFTRIYAYMFLGMTLTLTVKITTLIFSLINHAGLPTTFAYGILAAFNLLPRVKRQVQLIRYSANLRGISYHLWQPQLYFKAILSALQWSTDLAQAMTVQGFSEGYPRTQTYQDPLPVWQWWLATSLILLYLAIAIFGGLP